MSETTTGPCVICGSVGYPGASNPQDNSICPTCLCNPTQSREAIYPYNERIHALEQALKDAKVALESVLRTYGVEDIAYLRTKRSGDAASEIAVGDVLLAVDALRTISSVLGSKGDE